MRLPFVELTTIAVEEPLVVTSRRIEMLPSASSEISPLPASKMVPFTIVISPVFAVTDRSPAVLVKSPAAVKVALVLAVRLTAPFVVVTDAFSSRPASASSVIVPLPVVFSGAFRVMLAVESSRRLWSAFRSTLPETVIAPPRTFRL